MEKYTYQKMSDNEDSFWWYVARRKIINNAIRDLNINTETILEIGSGTGGNVNFLKKLGKYTGLEKENIAIDLSKKKHKDQKFIKSDIPQDLIKIGNKYDLIAMFDVIEHIENDTETLGKVKLLLKKGGTIILTTPAHPFLWSYHDETHHHFRRYTKKKLKDICIENDLIIHYHSYFNFFLFPIILLVRFYHKIKKDRTTDDVPVSRLTNAILKKIFGFESWLIPKVRLPFGVSHLIVLKKNKNNDR